MRASRSSAIIAFLLLAAACIARAQDEEARKHLLHTLGGPFIVYRTNVQEELKLSSDQKQALQEKLPGYLQEALDLEAGDREQKQSIRQKSYEKLWAYLNVILTGEQLTRCRQLELQHEGPAALVGRPEIARELKITDAQRNQFIAVVQDMQKKMEPLTREAHSGGDREAIRLRATKIYEDQEGRIEAILSESQRKQWKEMYGKPFDVFNDN
jgi:hypothetical protein